MIRTKVPLSLGQAWSCIMDWNSKEMQLQKVRRMFEKKEITNLTRIRLNQQIVNPQRYRAEGSAGDEK